MSNPRAKYQRRHYNDIAAMLREMVGTQPDLYTSHELLKVTHYFCRLFEADNPRFLRSRFEQAVWGNNTIPSVKG